ncbi:MAG: XRE family transcriptional regulator [Clostridia bacterium]|nr:XRE family transcriptional regulator [Clostridia bacterium]
MNFNKYNNNYNIIGQKLKEIRTTKNISQEYICNQLSLLGITLYQSDIVRIENNERTVRDFEL